MAMRALITDTVVPELRAGLDALGLEVTEDTTLGSHGLPEAVAGFDILIAGKTRITKRTIEAADALKLIVRAGSGTESIDIAAATARGILVTHCPDADAAARAEFILGAVIALDRQVARPFPQDKGHTGVGLVGRTLGLVGYDAVAQRVTEVALRYGLRVMVCAPELSRARASEAGVRYADSLEALMRASDIVSLHSPPNAGTVITADLLALLPDGATLVNTVKRGLIDLEAAKPHLEAGSLHLVLDVYDADDYGDDVPFAADTDGLLATLHLAGRTHQANDAIASTVVSNVETFLASDMVPFHVNVLAEAKSDSVLLVRYKQRGTVLAKVFEALREATIHVEGIRTTRFSDGVTALVRLTLDAPATPALLTALQRNPNVIDVHYRS
ncbi:MAG: D-3-phosphoglycerate dehydrogenase [Myxococcota bacterium]|jgi:D-3-phosphoglycerate dehydrogenase